ncbi:MAG: hypothetical protein V9E94_16940 [Microthrixaceae bacterium]
MADHEDSSGRHLAAAGGLSAVVHGDTVRIGWAGHDDWFGPGRFRIGDRDMTLADPRSIHGVDDLGEWTASIWLADRTASPRIDASLAAYQDQPLMVFSLRAPVGVDDGLSTGEFGSPCVSWPVFDPVERIPGGVPEDASAFGYQYMEFALPTASDAGFAAWTFWPFRPSVVMPLMCLSDAGALLLAPLDQFHEQVIAVAPDAEHAADGVRCGWHGDLNSVPKGFSTEFAVVGGTDARDCLDRWAELLVSRAGTRRLPRGIDSLGSHVSYWTDNGAAYWYRTAPAEDGDGRRSVTETLTDTLDDLRSRNVPFRSVQLDSWFYPHRSIRPFDTEAWDVPPTGLSCWEARDDILPDGISALRRQLGDPPLVAHCRHLSSDSPYLEQHDCWVDGEYAHPADVSLYERYLDQAAGWGVQTFEHDWLVECFLGVRGLRESPGRARRWQAELDAALARRGMTAQWCMATPADIMETTHLSQVTSIRTSGDHGYLVPPELLWAWFLYTNALVRPLGLWPYKDVFRSDGHGGSTDPGAEAALAALSGGPVGIGDPLGGASRELVLRTARADGLLVAPDAPIAAIGRCFARHGVLEPEPVVGATHSVHSAGRWSYVVTMHCHDGSGPLSTTLHLPELGNDTPADSARTPVTSAAVLDWRSGQVALVDSRSAQVVEVAPKAWALHVLAPLLLDGRLAVFGDSTRYATAGRQLISDVEERDGSVRVRLAGASERVVLVGWSNAVTLRAEVTTGTVAARQGPGSVTELEVLDGRWELAIDLPAEPGSATVELLVQP